MTDSRADEVDDRLLELEFDELTGRAQAPDRLDDILQRASAAEDSTSRPVRRGPPATARWLVAACLLLGLAVTVVAALLERDRRENSRGLGERQRDAVVAGGNEPSPPIAEQQSPVRQAGEQVHDQALPKGTDPADLKVLRSAEAMLAAERRLSARLANGQIAGIDRILRFSQIGDWQYRDGVAGMPKAVRRFDGQKVLMLGFMLPIDEVEGMTEFLLVESLWSCCYGTPPNVHGLVRCRMPAGRRVDYQFGPCKIVGRFRVGATVLDGYCVDIYQLDVEVLEVLD